MFGVAGDGVAAGLTGLHEFNTSGGLALTSSALGFGFSISTLMERVSTLGIGLLPDESAGIPVGDRGDRLDARGRRVAGTLSEKPSRDSLLMSGPADRRSGIVVIAFCAKAL
jgi:hypothetical protein